MSLEHFHQLLKNLGESIGLPNLAPHQGGVCSLRFDDRLIVDLESDKERGNLILSSLVGVLKPAQLQEFYSELLEANLLWGGTSGATLGVDPATLTVFICQQERLKGMTSGEFQKLLKKFSDTALFWNERLSSSNFQKI